MGQYDKGQTVYLSQSQQRLTQPSTYKWQCKLQKCFIHRKSLQVWLKVISQHQSHTKGPSNTTWTSSIPALVHRAKMLTTAFVCLQFNMVSSNLVYFNPRNGLNGYICMLQVLRLHSGTATEAAVPDPAHLCPYHPLCCHQHLYWDLDQETNVSAKLLLVGYI